jgi:hypothetical protein
MFDAITSKVVSRRSLLAGGAMLGAGVALAGCSTAQIQQAVSDWNNVVTVIQNAVSTGAAYIPTVETIAAEAASLFGPAYEAIVVAGSTALNQVIADLEGAVNGLSPAASVALHTKLRASSPGAPIAIGVAPKSGVQVIGYK